MANDLYGVLDEEDEKDEEQPPRYEDEEELPGVKTPSRGSPVASPLAVSGEAKVASPAAPPSPIASPMASKLSDTLTPPPAGAIAPPTLDAKSLVAPPNARYDALMREGAGVSHHHGIGGALLKGLDVAGSVLSPGLMMAIPGTTMNHKLDLLSERKRENNDLAQQASQAKTGLEQAQTEEAQARAVAAKYPQPKPKEEEWSIVPGVQGPNGEPVQQEKNSGQVRVAPLPGASLATKGKPTSSHITYDNGIPVTVTDAEGKVYDVNDPKLPPELKPLVDSANRAHGQHVQEQSNSQAHAAALQQPNKNDARSDKSFQYNNAALDKVATPLDQTAQRIGRLNDAIAQNTPQADALVAPELLSVMAGGAGSGLRMNEAEISRIVGGRSKWETLKASVNQWSLDPSKANSITPEQRQEIRALVKTVQDKLSAKQKIIDDSRQALIDTDDPKEHRKVVADTKKKLDAIDAGTGEGGSLPDGGGKKIDLENAKKFLQEAGGDKKKAAELAKQHNWTE